jgi:aminoglycoside/choline kinase family phosphotransferase
MALVMSPPDQAPDFLAEHGWGGAAILPLAGDASFRRYFRVVETGRQAVLMDAPPEHEDCRPFLAVAEHLHRIGFAAPKIYAADTARGLVLLEDFGDARMAEVLAASPSREPGIYRDAIDLLALLHRHPAGTLPPYDLPTLRREADLLVDWYAPALGLSVDHEGWAAAWEAVLTPLLDQPPVTVLRDYHAENVMLLDGRSGLDALGLIDFQDALAGHPAYDLVSMLQDARRDVPEAIEAAMLQRYAAAAAVTDRAAFEAAYAVLGAQRNSKILGIFTRLWKRDGKPRYLSYQPRVWGYLERDLTHPALAPVAAWFDLNIAADARAAAWAEYAS